MIASLDRRLALAATTGLDTDPLAAVSRAAEVAQTAGAEILALPELHMSGGSRDPADAVPSDGPWAEALADIAQRRDLVLVVGYLEAATGGPFSAALVIGPDGAARANARRTHAAPHHADSLGRGGWLTIVPLAGRRVGLLLGHDLAAPEAARALVLGGADLLVALAADLHGPAAAAPAVRAWENGVPVAVATPSAAWAVDAGGARVGSSTADGPIAVVDLAGPGDAARQRVELRRPELYRGLVEPALGGQDRSAQAEATRRK